MVGLAARARASSCRSCVFVDSRFLFLGLIVAAAWMFLVHAVLAPPRPARCWRGAELGAAPGMSGSGCRRELARSSRRRRCRRRGGRSLLATLEAPLTAEASRFAVDAAVESGQPLLVVNAVESQPRSRARWCSATTRSCRRTSRSRCGRPRTSPTRSVSRSSGCGCASPRPVDALLELVAERAPGLLVLGPDPSRIRARRLRKATRRIEPMPAASSGSATDGLASSRPSRGAGKGRGCTREAARARRPAAFASRRAVGPWTPMIAASSPRLPRTGAAIPARSSSRSPTASAQPRARARSISRASARGSAIVRAV